MSLLANLKAPVGVSTGVSPGLQGLAIINEVESLQNPDTIPDISIDESFLNIDGRQNLKTKTATKTDIGHTQKSIDLPPDSLCGARISVYRHSGNARASKKNVATIGGVFRIGHRHFALTAAHVFFDNITITGFRADNALSVTNNTDAGTEKAILPPKVSEIYEVVIETYWPNEADPEVHAKPTQISIGLVAPSVLHRRKAPQAASLPEVIWNDELNWALIELKETAFKQINKLQMSSVVTLELKPPLFDQSSPSDVVVVVAGVSGAVVAKGLSLSADIKPPWSNSEISCWMIECELAVGDYGSMVVCPTTGIVYGMVVLHNLEKMIAYIVPAPAIFECILGLYSEATLTLHDMFSIGSPTISGITLNEEPSSQEFLRTPVVRSLETNVVNVFLSHLKNFTLQSFDGRRFIRRNSLSQWLISTRRDGIPNIDFMLDDAYPRNTMLPVTGEQISRGSESSLLIFSLLFELGRGHLIHSFLRQGLTDHRLPLDLPLLNELVSRMGLENADDIAREVYDAQWAYCPMVFDLEMERDVPAPLIVPIHQRQQINSKGESAILWQITVLEEFVSKRLQTASPRARFNDPTDKLGYRYHFAVKSSAKSQMAHFDSEVTAFKAFRTIPSMIGYLGNYSQKLNRPKRRAPSFSVSEEKRHDHGPAEINNILLEYGDFDLDEYFAATQPPVLLIQITQFWQEIAGVAEAISEIHNFSTRRAGIKQEYSGWHADIKPDNILNVKGDFKLADPGFAQFERSEKKLTRLSGGTKTYGSPEVHSAQRIHDTPVSQAIDIWSLGCVLSVAATWIILGWSGVTQFQQLRTEALKRLASRVPDRTRSRSRSTGQAPPFRTSGQTSTPGRGVPLPEGDCFHDGTDILEEVHQWHIFLRSVVRKSDDVSVQILDLVDNKMLVKNPTDRIEATELYRQMRLIVHNSETHNKDTTPSVVSRILLKTEEGSGGLDSGPKLSAVTLSSVRTDIASNSPVLRSRSRSVQLPPSHPPLSPRLNVGSASTVSGDEGEDHKEHEKRPLPRPFQNIVFNEMGGRSISSSIDIPISKARTTTMRMSGLGPTRRMSVSEARAEVDKKNRLFSRRKKDPFLMRNLENRDIEFLIDNGNTMLKHWPEVRTLIEILTSMVSDVDKDGYDLTFTTSPQRLKQKSSSRAIKSTMATDRAKPLPTSRTDMSIALDRVFTELFARIKAQSTSRPTKATHKNYTLIVLTDGVWRGMDEPHAVEDTIVRWMNEIARFEAGGALNKKRKDARSVTIQFIQFGNDEEATMRLQTLDQGLIDYEIPDIIDTEPADGNVWKMLLGSVQASFDYAEDKA